jgi:predicted HTH domain antitoxin
MTMTLTLTVPDKVLAALKTPHHRLQQQLTQEFAFTLYERGFASMGIARHYAGLNKLEFLEGLAQRGIQRHYYLDDFNEDLDYANHSE